MLHSLVKHCNPVESKGSKDEPVGDTLKSNPKVTLFGDGVFAKVIKLK